MQYPECWNTFSDGVFDGQKRREEQLCRRRRRQWAMWKLRPGCKRNKNKTKHNNNNKNRLCRFNVVSFQNVLQKMKMISD